MASTFNHHHASQDCGELSEPVGGVVFNYSHLLTHAKNTHIIKMLDLFQPDL